MGFLSRMQMYMKVDSVTGDVVKPSTYLGSIEIYGLTWPGEPLRSFSSTAPRIDAWCQGDVSRLSRLPEQDRKKWRRLGERARWQASISGCRCRTTSS